VTAVTTASARTAAEPRARFGDLVAAEWLKFWSLRPVPWGLLASGLAVLACNAGQAWDHWRYWHQADVSPARFVAEGMPLQDAFTTNAGIVMMIAAAAVGALAITGEYSTGLIRTTFTAVPARRSVLAAKVSVVAAVMTGFGVVVAAASFGVVQTVLSGRHAEVTIGSPGALRVVVASALLAPLSALAGAAAGVVVRHGAAAVAASIVTLQAFPLLIHDGGHTSAIVAHALPFWAWNRLVAIPFDRPGPYPWTLAGAWTMFAVWALAAAVLAITAAPYRDV
jgi:ABC-2 type transport system permease protein